MATYWSCYDYLLELHDMPGGQCGIVYMGVLLKYVVCTCGCGSDIQPCIGMELYLV